MITLEQAKSMFPVGTAIEYVGPIKRLRGRIFDVDMVSGGDGDGPRVYFTADGRWAYVDVADVRRPGSVPHPRADHGWLALALSIFACLLALLAYLEAVS